MGVIPPFPVWGKAGSLCGVRVRRRRQPVESVVKVILMVGLERS